MNAFQVDKRIRLHDLTWADMHAFVSSRLSGIIPTEDTADDPDFTFQIVEKADSKFLWVTLVVKEIRRRHENQDIDDTSKFLEYLPVDLEGLFRYIIRELVHPEDRPMAHRTFFMTLNLRDRGLPYVLWEYSFLNDYVENPDFCIESPKKPIDNYDCVVQAMKPARNRLRGWCRGLLEVHPGRTKSRGRVTMPGVEINFSHRSIPEFLSTEEMKAEGRKWTASFNWVDAFSKMYLASCQSFSDFTLDSGMMRAFLTLRLALGLDLEPPFTYLAALESCCQRQWDASRRRMTHERASVHCRFDYWFASNWHEAAPGFPEEDAGSSIEMPLMPSIHLTLMDGDHPYPTWRLSHGGSIVQDEVFITIICGASIGNSCTLPLHQLYQDTLALQPPGQRIGYRLLDALADSSDLTSQLPPGFSLRDSYYKVSIGENFNINKEMLYCTETVGVLGQYLVAWFRQACYWHPSFRRAETLKHIGKRFGMTYSESVQDALVDRFGSVLARLFRIDQSRLRFEAHATLGLLADRYCTHVKFAIGDLAQKPRWTLQQKFDRSHLSRDDYVADIPEVASQHTWTLEDIIKTTNPPNRDTLLRMISERNSAISGLSALRLDDRGTPEDT